MDENCPCYSCSQFRNYWNKIDFLKRKETDESSALVNDISVGPFNRLPDEVLIHILECISPNNMDNFVTLIGLEMVSKRIRHCMAKANEKIWGNVTELVLGFHPDLPDNEYLCHIGRYSLLPFLRRAKKITKVIINYGDNCYWSCAESPILGLIGVFAEKLEAVEEIEAKLSKQEVYRPNDVDLLFLSLECAKQSLQTCNLRANGSKEHLAIIAKALQCSNLKLLKIFLDDWIDISSYNIFFLSCVLRHLKPIVESLEIIGLPQISYGCLLSGLQEECVSSQLQTLRLTNPQVRTTHLEPTTFREIGRILQQTPLNSIRHFEVHYCPHSDDFSTLPDILENTHLKHLKITFHPYFEFCKTAKVIELLENTQVKSHDEMKITITFLHSEADYEAKVSIIHHLLDQFDAPHTTQQENVWGFIRNKLTVNFKLEKMQDASLICHSEAPPANQ